MDELWYATEPCGCATGAADGDLTENAARRLLNGSLSQAMTDHRTYMRAPRSEIRERMPLRCPHQRQDHDHDHHHPRPDEARPDRAARHHPQWPQNAANQPTHTNPHPNPENPAERNLASLSARQQTTRNPAK